MPQHPNDPEYVGDQTPSNIEAEHALLGVLLYDNASFLSLDGVVSPQDFHEPFHGRLYKLIEDMVRVGRLADPITLHPYFAIDPAYDDLGGARYLFDLVDKAPPTANAPDYARAVRSASLKRDVIRICRDVAQRAVADADADGLDLMAMMEKEVLGVRSTKSDVEFRDFDEVADEVVDGMDRPDERPLIKIGHTKIDNAVGGFERGDLIILGGRPGMGKSAISGCWALHVARAYAKGLSDRPLGVVEISEMSEEQMMRRHLTDYAFERFGDKAPFYRDIRRKTLTDEQKRILYQCRDELRRLPLKLLCKTHMTTGRLHSLLRRQKMIWKAQGIDLSLAVLDHAGLFRPDTAGRGRTEDQTEVSGAMKHIARELGIASVVLSQLSRKIEERDDKRPTLSDLRDSGSWEQDADMVIGMYRDSYYARREREPKGDLKMAEWQIRCGSREVEAIMLKVREGEVATAKLWADIGRNAIRDHEPTDQLAF